MKSKRENKDYVLLFLKGVGMGLANKIPGVSGGIIAIVTGFYEELLFSFKRLNLRAIILLLKGRYKSFWFYINGNFLFTLLLGVIVSYFTLSIFLNFALMKFPMQVWSMFFGLVLASAFILLRDYKNWNKKNIFFAIMGLGVGIILSILSPSNENTNFIFVFVCGVVSIVGMTLPGLSGSFLLILLGNYKLLLIDAVNAFGRVIINPLYSIFLESDQKLIINDGDYHLTLLFIIFLSGSLTGISTLSSIIHNIKKKANDQLEAILIGFVFGSLFILWPTSRANLKFESTFFDILSLILIGLIGVLIVYILDYYGQKK